MKNFKKNFYGYSDKKIYLDNGASTLSLKCVKNEVDNFLKNYGSLHRGSGYNSEISTKKFEEAREYILKSINGDPKKDCVIFTSNTTDAINKFVLIHKFNSDEKILISDIEHTSNFLPWIKHNNVITFKTDKYKIKPEIIEKYLKEDNKIKCVAIATASNITGYIVDYKKIYRICQKYGVLLFLDNSQYAPHNIPDLQYCDAMAYCGHKMYAPFGCGILAGKKKVLNFEGDSLTGGGNVIYVNKNNKPFYKPLPYIHEAGTPNGVGAIAMAKSHYFLYEKIGRKGLTKHTNQLINAIFEESKRLKDYGYDVYFCDTKEYRTPIMIVDCKFMDNKTLVSLLNKRIDKYHKPIFVREGAFCAYRLIENLKNLNDITPKIVDDHLNEKYSLIRFSAGLINTPRDIKYTVDKLIAISNNYRE